MSFLVLVMAATVAAGGGPPPTPPPNAPAAAAPSAKTNSTPSPDPDRVVCRDEALTGSRFTKRICLPQSEWNQMAQQADRVARMRNEHVQGGGIGSGSTPP